MVYEMLEPMSPPSPCIMSYTSLVPRPTSQLRMDYITATRIVGLVSSCTNFCPVAPECWSDQSDLRYALIAYSSYQSKLLVMAVRLEMDVQVKRAIQSVGERMGHAKVKDEQFRVIEDVVRGRDAFVSLPTVKAVDKGELGGARAPPNFLSHFIKIIAVQSRAWQSQCQY